jgi:DNA-binding response OmpR family regulator
VVNSFGGEIVTVEVGASVAVDLKIEGIHEEHRSGDGKGTQAREVMGFGMNVTRRQGLGIVVPPLGVPVLCGKPSRPQGFLCSLLCRDVPVDNAPLHSIIRRMRILLLEDQSKLLSFAKKGLEEQGIQVDAVSDGDEAWEMATTVPYDALVLDIMVPGRDGLSLLRGLREKRNSVPVILLTARSTLPEKIEGLNLGADDYMTKPFFVEELAARLRTVVRRKSGDSSHLLRVDDLSMNLIERKVSRDGAHIELSAREFELLEHLMRSPGRVFGRMQIYEHVWGYNMDPETNLVEVYIQRLRSKIDKDHEKKLIRTVRGVGYALGGLQRSA